MVISGSSTQVADFVRRTSELVALFVAWWTFRRVHRTAEISADQRQRLERHANRVAGGAMALSGSALLVIAVVRFSDRTPYGNVVMGLVIASLGLLTNSWFWFRYRSLTRERFNPIISTQQRLYRAKSLVDLCVVVVLTAVALAPVHPATRVLDVGGSVVVAAYLLWSGLRTLARSDRVPDSGPLRAG